MDILSILKGLGGIFLDPATILYVFIGSQAGILFGMMPVWRPPRPSAC
jgi:TctA family transporter